MVAGAVLAATGCPAAEEWRNADLQVDVRADLPDGAARVRICVDGAGSRTQGAGPVAYAVPGVPMDGPAVVTADVLAVRTGTGPWDEDTGGAGYQVMARGGPVTLDAATPWAEVALEAFVAEGADPEADCPECPAPCTTSGAFADDEEDSWLLAVRFRP